MYVHTHELLNPRHILILRRFMQCSIAHLLMQSCHVYNSKIVDACNYACLLLLALCTLCARTEMFLRLPLIFESGRGTEGGTGTAGKPNGYLEDHRTQ